MFTHYITRGYKDSSGVTTQSTETIVDNSERNYDNAIAALTVKQPIVLAITRASLKAFEMYSDKAVTLFAEAAATFAVAGVTNTNAVDAQINVTAHGLAVGQAVHILAIGGASNLNGFYYVKTVVDSDHFKISATLGGSIIQGNGASYTSGGTVQTMDAISLAAGQNSVWNLVIDGLSALLVTHDTDNFYVDNASSTDTANVKIRALEHL